MEKKRNEIYFYSVCLPYSIKGSLIRRGYHSFVGGKRGRGERVKKERRNSISFYTNPFNILYKIMSAFFDCIFMFCD